jgi:hypothetical protein
MAHNKSKGILGDGDEKSAFSFGKYWSDSERRIVVSCIVALR